METQAVVRTAHSAANVTVKFEPLPLVGDGVAVRSGVVAAHAGDEHRPAVFEARSFEVPREPPFRSAFNGKHGDYSFLFAGAVRDICLRSFPTKSMLEVDRTA